jgi:hypothetical protein
MNENAKDALNDALKLWADEYCDELDWGFIQALVDQMVDAVEAVYNTATALRNFMMGS